jgi:hypothetical protein
VVEVRELCETSENIVDVLQLLGLPQSYFGTEVESFDNGSEEME